MTEEVKAEGRRQRAESGSSVLPAALIPLSFPRSGWRTIGVLIFILAVAAGFRIARARYACLSFDEIWHLELSTGRGSPHVRVPENVWIASAPAVTSLAGAPPWYAVWTHMDFVVHPPLYVTLLRLWRDVFGEGDLAARMYSVFCSLVAIALMFLAARELNGTSTAVWAALIYALAPTQIYIAQQVRGYDQLAVFGMGAAYCLTRIEKERGLLLKNAIMLCFCLVGMMLSHYFAIGAAAAMGVYVLLRFRGRKLRFALSAMIVGAIIFFAAWGPFLWEQRTYFAQTADVWLIEKTPRHFSYTIARLCAWCWWLIVRDDSYNIPLAAILMAVLAGVVLLLPPMLMAISRRRDLLLWYLWLLGTLGFVTALDLCRSTSHLRYERYVSLASPAVFVLIAGLSMGLPAALRYFFPSAVILMALCNSSLAYVTEGEPDWKAIGAKIDQLIQKDETLIFYQGIQPKWFVEIFYLTAAHYSHGFPRPIIKMSSPASTELIRQIPGSTAWVVSGKLDPPLSQVISGSETIEPMPGGEYPLLTHIRLPR